MRIGPDGLDGGFKPRAPRPFFMGAMPVRRHDPRPLVIVPCESDVPDSLREVAAYLQGIAQAVSSMYPPHPSAVPEELPQWQDGERPSGTRLRLASLPDDLFFLTGT
jgi:hypothetical protein